MSIGFFRFRDAVFTTVGYNLNVREAAPGGLRRESSAHFVPQNSEGKAIGMERVAGCEAKEGADIFIHLRPYRSNRDRARAAVEIACAHLGDAARGEPKAQSAFGVAVAALVVAESKATPDVQEKIGLFAALYGPGRMTEMLNRSDAPEAIHPGAMVAEVFAPQAA